MTTIRSVEKKIWTVDFYFQGASEKAYRRGRSSVMDLNWKSH
jgi:hypothetical protein